MTPCSGTTPLGETIMGMKNDKKEVPDPGARLACAECVNDSYLRELIGRGEKRECSYGHKASGTIALVDLAEYIRRVFKNRYIISKDTGTARIPFTSETNSDVVLNNEGSSVEEIIRRETGAGKELANDLQRVMEKLSPVTTESCIKEPKTPSVKTFAIFTKTGTLFLPGAYGMSYRDA